jgi:hypothetical protein
MACRSGARLPSFKHARLVVNNDLLDGTELIPEEYCEARAFGGTRTKDLGQEKAPRGSDL